MTKCLRSTTQQVKKRVEEARESGTTVIRGTGVFGWLGAGVGGMGRWVGWPAQNPFQS